MKIAVFINVKAGPDEKDKTLMNVIRTSFQKHNIDPLIINISKKNTTKEIEKVIRIGPDIITASGGDGTVSLIASFLQNKDITLAVIPTGTLNHFAKDLNIPLDTDAAVDNIFTGKVIKIDTAEVNDKMFLNNSSIGIYPHAVKKRKEHQRREKFGKWKAMFYALLHVFFRFPLYAVKIIADSKTEIIRSPFIFIGNNEYKMDFLSLGSRDSLNKGKLSIFVARTKTRFGILLIIAKLLLNYIIPFNIFELKLVNEVDIESKKNMLHVALDGEVEDLNTPLKYKIKHNSLKVIVPGNLKE